MLFAPSSNPYDKMLHHNPQLTAATFMAAEHHGGRELKQTIIRSEWFPKDDKTISFPKDDKTISFPKDDKTISFPKDDKTISFPKDDKTIMFDKNTINGKSWETLSNNVKPNKILAYNDFGNQNEEPFDEDEPIITYMAVRYHGKTNNTEYSSEEEEKEDFRKRNNVVPKKSDLPRIAKMVACHHGKRKFISSTDMAIEHHGRRKSTDIATRPTKMATRNHGIPLTRMATRNHGKETSNNHVNPFSDSPFKK